MTPSTISASEYPLETPASICLMRLMKPILSFWFSRPTWPCILNSFWKTLLRSSPVFSALTCRPKEVFSLPLILISCLPSPEKPTSDLVLSSSNLSKPFPVLLSLLSLFLQNLAAFFSKSSIAFFNAFIFCCFSSCIPSKAGDLFRKTC